MVALMVSTASMTSWATHTCARPARVGAEPEDVRLGELVEDLRGPPGAQAVGGLHFGGGHPGTNTSTLSPQMLG